MCARNHKTKENHSDHHTIFSGSWTICYHHAHWENNQHHEKDTSPPSRKPKACFLALSIVCQLSRLGQQPLLRENFIVAILINYVKEWDVDFEMAFETCQYISSGEREKRKQAFSKTQDCERGKTEEKHTINKRPTRKPSGCFFYPQSRTGKPELFRPCSFIRWQAKDFISIPDGKPRSFRLVSMIIISQTFSRFNPWREASVI